MRQIESTGVIAIIRASSSDELIEVVNALHEGGVTCIEVTMTTPNALEVIRKARKAVGDSAAIGVGTVMDSETARSSILAGAQFVVSPILDLPTVEICKQCDVPVVPGALSPTEIVRAWQAGVDMVKVFPTGALGPKYIQDLRGPLPHIKYVPTGGVNLDTAADFIHAGAAALGVGSSLVTKEAVNNRDFATIKATAAEFLKRVRQARET
ncbi:MAG: bifunctional 4-hydroxy-2-oxoglutarate aldolase/2-dehydro-3-deoxy-phosphogluconate aldolase [Planctomycetota bacterium]|nr:MAG: bifunctional 4-hydroxy-2-oxoglutarate aldolase/2-dehydro-3-deoxy-phosphogluconate aldolase [Planctomycetota bacterium]